MSSIIRDLTKEGPFGKLTVVGRQGKNSSGNYQWLCRCSCPKGNERVVSGGLLTTGKTTACLDCTKEAARQRASRVNSTHGYARLNNKDPLYSHWTSMKRRCYNENPSHSKYWGKKGVIVCDEWKNSFPAFREWSLANGFMPNSGLSLNRIDSKGNYEPSNCEWSTRLEQNRNRESVHRVVFRDKEYRLPDLWEEYGTTSQKTFYRRYITDGWELERALFEVPRIPKRTDRVTINGEAMGVKEAWEKLSVVSYSTFTSRYDMQGWDIEKALFTPPLIDRKKPPQEGCGLREGG